MTLNVRTHADRIKSAENPPPWIIPKYIAEGTINALVALPGGAKTAMATEIATCLAAGWSFADLGECRQGRVLYVATDSAQDTENRLTALNGDVAQEILTVAELERLPMGMDALRAAIEEIQPRLTVLDTWDSNRNHSEGGYAAQDGLTERIMDDLRKAAVEYKTAFLINHHATRNDSGRARGPVVFDAKCDTIAKVVNANGKVELVLIKNRKGRVGSIGTFRIDTATAADKSTVPVLQFVGKADEREIRLRSVMLAIDKGATTKKEISEAANVPEGSVSSLLRKLRQDEFLEQKQTELTELGKDWLDAYES